MSEQQLHAAIVEYLALNEDPGEWVYFHPDNGAYRKSFAARRNAKARGVRAGVPDIILDIRGRIVYVEIKAPKGRANPAQKVWQTYTDLRCTPGHYFVVRSIHEMQDVLRRHHVNLRGVAA